MAVLEPVALNSLLGNKLAMIIFRLGIELIRSKVFSEQATAVREDDRVLIWTSFSSALIVICTRAQALTFLMVALERHSIKDKI